MIANPSPAGSGAAAKRRPRLASLRRYATWYLFLAPNLVLFLVFTVFTWGFLVFLSFNNWSLIGDRLWVGLGNYVDLINDSIFWQALQNTVVYTLMFVLPVAAIGLFLAALLNQRLPLIGLFRGIYYLPVVTSVSVISLVWRFILVPRPEGPLNWMLGLIGIGPHEWLLDVGSALPAITAMQVWATMGYYMILWLAGLQSVPMELHEAASIDGAGRWATFRFVTLPMLKPTTIFIVMIATIGALQMFGAVYLLTGGGPINSTITVVYYIWQTAFQTYRMGYGAATSLVLFVIILAVSLLQRRFLGWTEEIY